MLNSGHILNITFPPVAFVAQHLTIIYTDFTTFTPWGDMICLRLVKPEIISAFRTNAILPFKCLSLL